MNERQSELCASILAQRELKDALQAAFENEARRLERHALDCLFKVKVSGDASSIEAIRAQAQAAVLEDVLGAVAYNIENNKQARTTANEEVNNA